MERSSISPRTVYFGIALFVFLLAGVLVGLYFVYRVQQLVLAFGVTLLLSVMLSAPVNLLARLGLPRSLATVATLGALAAALWLFWRVAAATLSQQLGGLLEDLPRILEEAIGLANGFLGSLGLAGQLQLETQTILEAAGDALDREALLTVAGAGMTLVNVVSLGVLVLFATVYLVSRPQPWINGFTLLFPARKRQRVREILENVYRTVQTWVLGQMASMLFIGVSSALALYLIGVPFALLLGIFGGLISFVPILGAVASAIPPILIALVTDPVLVLWVILAYIVIQQIEGNTVQPLVMSRMLALHPAQVLFAIFLGGTLAGFVGVLLAVPALATAQVLVNELWVGRMNRVGKDPAPPGRGTGSGGDGLARRLRRTFGTPKPFS